MIKRFNEFTEVNEGVGSFIKKLFSGLIDDIKEDFKKPLEDFTKKASNIKDPKQMKNVVEEYLKSNYNTLNKSLDSDNTPQMIHTTTSDNLKAIYTSISAVNDTIGNFKFEDIFSDITDKNTQKLFTKGAKFFDKNVESFARNIIMKFDNSISEEDLTKSVDETEKDTIQQTQDTQDQNTNNDLTKLKTDIKKWFDNTLYKSMRSNLDFEVQDSSDGNSDDNSDISSNINNNKLSNKDGIKKILSNISSISDSKQMAKLRDSLIEMGHGNKDEYGTF